MKYIYILAFIMLLSCQKNKPVNIPDIEGKMKVIKNCAGYYLLHNTTNYKVCNRELLNNYNDGDIITVSLRKTKDCSYYPYTECAMAFGYSSWVEILSVK
ncbi:hypothetical protein [Niabella aquatica]